MNFSKGDIPPPESFDSVTVFLCDIVQFTVLSGESTAQQVIEMLNSLYGMFDSRIDAYNVYKVFEDTKISRLKMFYSKSVVRK